MEDMGHHVINTLMFMYILCIFSDGGFLAHNASKDTYPAPIPTKKVNFTGNGAAITDANHNTGNNICDLPAYNDCIVSNLLI